jgi:large subunit ribosomal protein L10
MNKNEKAEQISEIVERLKKCGIIYLVDYKALNVEDISKIRKEFRKEGIEYKVFKNTLFKRALDETGKFPKLTDHLKGMTGYIFAGDNPSAPAKIIKKYFDEKQKLGLKAAYIESEFYGPDQLNALSSLPSKAEVIAGIIGSVASPASGLVGTVNAVIRELVSVIDEVAKEKAA